MTHKPLTKKDMLETIRYICGTLGMDAAETMKKLKMFKGRL